MSTGFMPKTHQHKKAMDTYSLCACIRLCTFVCICLGHSSPSKEAPLNPENMEHLLSRNAFYDNYRQCFYCVHI